MNIKRIIISFFLLLTYSLGFAHNIIPHQHDSETHTHNHSHDDVHHHSHNNSLAHNDHQHVSHGDHFDESLYDLLVCFLHETDFKTDDCNVYYIVPPKANISTKVQTQQLLAVVSTLFEFVPEKESNPTKHIVAKDATKNHLSPTIANSPLRGPPVHS